jgi:hypothetical protein
MKKRADTLKVLVAAMVLGVLANTSAIPAYAKDHDMAESARVTAIHDCNVEPINSILSLNSQTSLRCTQRA